MSENAYGEYLRLREDWHWLVNAPDAPMRSKAKDALYATLTSLWSRLRDNERRCAAKHCQMVGLR